MGRALGKQLAQKGANVVIVARDKVKLENALLYISVSMHDLMQAGLNLTSTSLQRASRASSDSLRFLQTSQTRTKTYECSTR